MNQDANFYIAFASVSLFALLVTAYTVVRMWNQWIDLKRSELNNYQEDNRHNEPSTMSRIEVADLKERVRKLEAIAAGIDI